MYFYLFLCFFLSIFIIRQVFFQQFIKQIVSSCRASAPGITDNGRSRSPTDQSRLRAYYPKNTRRQAIVDLILGQLAQH